MLRFNAGPGYPAGERRHGPEGEHAHGGKAFTVWLDPTLAQKQADAIYDAFTQLRPQHAEEFSRNRDALARDLAEVVAVAQVSPV